MRPLRILVVDDSAYVRKTLSFLLQAEPDLQVVGTAGDGVLALQRVEELKPDLVTVDLEMPVMDGLQFIREQMRRKPLPLLVVSGLDQGGDLASQALLAGAVDFVQKPTKLASSKLAAVRKELVAKVRLVGELSPEKLVAPSRPGAVLPPLPEVRPEAVVIGVSTGGPQALNAILPELPSDYPIPLLLVIHMPVGFTEPLARRLNGCCAVSVREAAEGLEPKPGLCLVGKAGRRFVLRRGDGGEVQVGTPLGPATHSHRPSVDELFQSAAEVFGAKLVALVLTGMGQDGKGGAAWVKSEGGSVYCQTEGSCVVYGMPRAVAESNLNDGFVELVDIPTLLSRLGELPAG